MNHVVVVEDDPHNAILFRKILEKRAGCNVTLTEDPAEVLELVRGGDVALLILDVSLRHSKWQGRPAGGVEICQLVRSQALPHVPVLLCTATPSVCSRKAAPTTTWPSRSPTTSASPRWRCR